MDFLLQFEESLESKDLKHIGETNPALVEFRSQRQQQSWCASPSHLLDAIATMVKSPHASCTTVSTPQSVKNSPPSFSNTPESSLTKPPHASSSSLSTTKTPIQLQSVTTPHLKGGQSAPAKLHTNQHHQKEPGNSTARVESSRTRNKQHPLVTVAKQDPNVSGCPKTSGQGGGSRVVGRGPTTECAKVSGQAQSSGISGQGKTSTTPSGQGQTSSCPKLSGQKQTVSTNNSNNSGEASTTLTVPFYSVAAGNPQTDDSGADRKGQTENSNSGSSAYSSEEARKFRQAQQKLQKEKWQKQHGLGVKRHSEGSVGTCEVELSKEWQTVDGFCLDELVSDGKILFHLYSQHFLLILLLYHTQLVLFCTHPQASFPNQSQILVLLLFYVCGFFSVQSQHHLFKFFLFQTCRQPRILGACPLKPRLFQLGCGTHKTLLLLLLLLFFCTPHK